jgi:hypothetical protein
MRIEIDTVGWIFVINNEQILPFTSSMINVQGNSQVPPELPNSAAQQPRQTQQKGYIEHL